MTADDLKRHLGLQPLPGEGGFYAETYRAPLTMPASALPAGYESPRVLSTAIYYLLTPDTCSLLHRLPGDEVYHFYLGDPVDLLQLGPDGEGTLIALGPRLHEGMTLQHVVTGGCWQGSRLRPGGAWALLGTTMAPGFDFADFEPADRQNLIARYPDWDAWIESLT